MPKIFDKVYNFLDSYFSTESSEDVGEESFFSAMKCYDNKEYDKALELYKIALKYEPNSDATYFNMGNVYFVKKDYEQALIYYKQALLLYENSPNANLQIARVYFAQEKYEESKEIIDTLLKKNPNDDFALSMMSSLLLIEKKYNESLNYSLQLFDNDKPQANILANISVAYFYLGKYEKSIEFGLKLIELEPNNPSVYCNIFEAQLMLHRVFSKNLEETFIEKFSNDKESFILYSHLKILENISLEKEVNLEEWEATYEGVNFINWEFETIEKWIKNYENEEIKVKLLEALECFKQKSN